MLSEILSTARELRVRQRREIAELFGVETRNKYEIQDASGTSIGFAAEQGKGIGHLIGRYFLGHWRNFDVNVFTGQRQLFLKLVHPFRWVFQRIEVFTAEGKAIGALQQRFTFLYTTFDLEDGSGARRMRVERPLFSPWTFTFRKDGHSVATVKKRWSGLLKEAFTDGDNFSVHFEKNLTNEERQMILASAFFIDIHYFEEKARRTS